MGNNCVCKFICYRILLFIQSLRVANCRSNRGQHSRITLCSIIGPPLEMGSSSLNVKSEPSSYREKVQESIKLSLNSSSLILQNVKKRRQMVVSAQYCTAVRTAPSHLGLFDAMQGDTAEVSCMHKYISRTVVHIKSDTLAAATTGNGIKRLPKSESRTIPEVKAQSRH